MKEIIYSSLSHRIVACWANTMPAFHPLIAEKTDMAPSVDSQQQFHAFLSEAAIRLREHPEWLELPNLQDDGYDHFELLNRRPGLSISMHKIRRKMTDFLYLLFQIGLAGELTSDCTALRLPKTSLRFMEKTRLRLERFGLTVQIEKIDTVIQSGAYPLMLPSWQWLAKDSLRTAPANGKKNEPPLRFMHAIFDEAYPYSSDFFRQHCVEEPGLSDLLDWLRTEGYQMTGTRENRVTADWVKSYGKKDEPLKDAWAERTHGGFAMEYEWVKKKPVQFALRIPEFKKLLVQFDAMPSQVRALVVRHTKKCDNCGYCTQTDKTGTRKKAFIVVDHDCKRALCPLFPGFGFTWRDMDEQLASVIKDFLTFIDQSLTGRQT